MTAHRIGLFPENDTTNGWAAHLPPRAPRPALAGDVAADWIVVGAGWAGLAAARRLAENRPSDRIVIIDAAAVADGASGRNSGFAIDLPHTIGGTSDENESALGYMRLARGAIAYLKHQIDAHGIECDWREQGKYQAAVTDRGVAEYLEPFAAALARLGEPFEWIEGPELAARLGTSHFTRAVYTPGGALLNPVALVRGLADSLDFQEARGLRGDHLGEAAEGVDQSFRDGLHVPPRYGQEQEKLQKLVVWKGVRARVHEPRAQALAVLVIVRLIRHRPCRKAGSGSPWAIA